MNISKVLLNVVSLATIWLAAKASAQVPLAITVRDATVITTLHAEGAQIYECKSFAGKSPSEVGTLTWQFREPIATLIVDGKSVGRHYAGPNWEHIDGSAVKGKVNVSVPGPTSSDIPWLELEVVDHRKDGILSAATTIQRVNTKGGLAQGSCESEGKLLSVPYAADYVFLRKGT